MQFNVLAEKSEEKALSLRGSNQSGVRAHNERLVLSLLRGQGPLPKAEIARISGLSAQTVSVIMRSLEADGLLEKCKPVRGKVGQPSVPMRLAENGALFFGLKVGRRSLDLVLINFLGKVIGHRHLAHSYPDPDKVVHFANSSISALLADLPDEMKGRIAGMGIAIPFNLWDWAPALGVDQSIMEAWRHRDISAEIEAVAGFPVFLQNDATSACGAELVFGTNLLPRSFLYFYVGFFIGGGIVLDRQLFTGSTGNAGALGSMPIGAGAEGKPLQLVDAASLAVLEQQIIADGGSSDSLWLTAPEWSVKEHLVEKWLSEAAQAMAFAIGSAVSVLDCPCTIIDGYLPSAIRDRLVVRTREAFEALRLTGLRDHIVEAGTIGAGARAIGAASLPLSERFLIDQSAMFKA